MVKQAVTINNASGLHARPAMMLVKEASKYESHINIVYGSNEVNAKSIMGIMSMGLTVGAEIEITADGIDEKEALQGILALFESNFGE